MRVAVAALLALSACTASVAPQPQSADMAAAALTVPTDAGAGDGAPAAQCAPRPGQAACPTLRTLEGQPTWVGCSYTQWLSSRLSLTCDCVGTDGGAVWDCAADKGRPWAHHIGPPPAAARAPGSTAPSAPNPPAD